jgi:glutathione S-transferase
MRRMDLVLYVADPASVPAIGVSPPSWMCEAVLAAKCLTYRRVALSFARGEHRSEAMLARNPRGTIPVLTHADAVVHETLAILLYAEWLAPGHLPEERGARATALTRFMEAEHLKAAGMKAFAYLMRTSEAERDPTVLREHATELRAELDRWDACLEDGWVAAGIATLADYVVHAYVATLSHLGMSLERWPRVAAHHERMSALEAFSSTRPPGWRELAAGEDPWADLSS